MSDLKGKRILIFQQRGWGMSIGHRLARHLQEEGCVLAAFTLKRSTHAFTLGQKEVRYERIVNNDEIMADPHASLDETISLGDVCADLGIDSVWPFVMALRNHVRSYGEKFYYGYTPNASDEEIAAYVKALYLGAKRLFETFKPDLILAPNFVSLPHIVFNLCAKRTGVPMTAVTDSKVRGMYLFCHDYLDTNEALRARIEALNGGTASSPNEGRARAYIEDARKTFRHPTMFKDPNEKTTLLQRIGKELSPYRAILSWYRHRPINHLKNLGVTGDYRPPRIILRDHYCKKAYKRFIDRFPFDPFDQVGKFAYLPLQFQPEETIDVKAPYFNNQIETARQVAMSMPDDYVLVIKEHPAMVGYRSPSYIRKIARLVNVKFIDYRISSADILKRADLIVSQNSTSTAEAAYFNKPAIQLGNLATTRLLPNVVRHTDMTTLAPAIRSALRTDMKSEAYERRLRNFVAAVYDVGFELEYVRLWEEGGSEEERARLWKIYRAEIARLLRV